MNPSDLKVDQVRSELEQLIMKYPEYTGMSYDEFDDSTCVYYLNEVGMPISSNYYSSEDRDEVVFETPICIVGQWINTFHPEFKDNDLIKAILVLNTTLNLVEPEDNPFTKPVLDLLSKAQYQQDTTAGVWGNIDLDVGN